MPHPVDLSPSAETPADASAPTLAGWLARVESRSLRVGIVGLGYVGLPLALMFAEERFQVLGLDIDPEKVASLNIGQSYIHRIEPSHIAAARARGFTATADYSEVSRLDAILLCVPTPLHDDHTPDLSFVQGTVDAIAPHLRNGQLVVLESTTYPGTTEEIVVRTLEQHGHTVLRPQATTDNSKPSTVNELPGILVAFSPEREDPGNLLTPRRQIPKVIGAVSPEAAQAAEALYGSIFDRTVLVSSPAAAEMTKLLENIYRNVNIALVNELKQLCQAFHLDVWEIIDAAATKPFGFQPFYPGPGVGGHCIPVDPFYLSWKAAQLGFHSRFIALAGEINESMPSWVIEQTAHALAARNVSLAQANVLVLGVAYKRDVDDLRESPALVLIEMLRAAGAHVSYSDPFFPTVGRGRHYALDMTSHPLSPDMHEVAAFDCVLLATDHSAFDIEALVRHARLLIDTRNATRNIARPLTGPQIIRC